MRIVIMFIFLALQGGHAESTELQKPIGYQKPAPPPELVAAANAAATGKPFGGYEVKSNGKIVGGQGVVGVPLWQSDNGKVSVGGSLSAGFVGGKGTGAIKRIHLSVPAFHSTSSFDELRPAGCAQ